jgi:hypothetical protein
MDAVGQFVVVWNGIYDPMSSDTNDVVGRRFDASGAALGPPFRINAPDNSTEMTPDVAINASGESVVVWKRLPTAEAIRGQRYDAAGSAVGGEFLVLSYTTGTPFDPRVAVDDAGRFVVVWEQYNVPGDPMTDSVQARLYDAAGVPVGPQFRVNTYTTGLQGYPDVASDPDGNFVVVWQSSTSPTDLSQTSVHAQRYDSAGVPVGAQFQVNTTTTGLQIRPTVAVDGNGNFVVAWTSLFSPGTDTLPWSVVAQRYDATGTPLGPEFQVNTYTTNNQESPRAAMDADGDFVITWASQGSAGTDTAGPTNESVQAQRYDAAGMPVGTEFQVNTYTTDFQWYGAVAMDAGANFVIVWQSPGFLPGIYAQRYEQGTTTSSTSTTSTSSTSTSSTSSSTTSTSSTSSTSSSSTTVTSTSSTSSSSDTSSTSSSSTSSSASSTSSTNPPTQLISGVKMLVKDPTGSEESRRVIVLAREPGDIGLTVLGNVVISGAQLRVVTTGTTPSDQTYLLNASGWTPLGSSGFRYRGPTGGDGDPVKQVIVKKTGSGLSLIKVLIKGNTGTQPLDVVPPNSGQDGGIVLDLGLPGRYCVTMGVSASSSVKSDTWRLWKVVGSPVEPPCIVP